MEDELKVKLINEARTLVHTALCCGPKMKFTISTKDWTEDEINDTINKLKESFKKNPVINPVNGEIDPTYKPVAIDRDYFM